ncbi:MAG: hypothetical protein IPJ65_01640 [Archangiaceae bacterium]|nr:hypothetical protein [Archangiaceae bacterium]
MTASSSAPSSSDSAAAARAAAAARRAAELARKRAEEARRRAAEAKEAAERAHHAQQVALARQHHVQQTQARLQHGDLGPAERKGLRAHLETQRAQWQKARQRAVDETRQARDAIALARRAQVSGQSTAARANLDAIRAGQCVPFGDSSGYDRVRTQNRRSFDRLFGDRSKHAEKHLDGLATVDHQARQQQAVAADREALAHFRQLRTAAPDPSQWDTEEAKRFTTALGAVADAKSLDRDVRARLIAQAQPQLKAAAGPLSTLIRKGDDGLGTDDRRAMYQSLSRATELMPADAQAAFAHTFAADMGDVDDIGGDDDDFGGILRDSIESGAGASLSTRIVKDLQAQDKGRAANSAAGYVDDAIVTLQHDFHAARTDLAEVNGRAIADVKAFGVGGTEGQAALRRFREQSDWADTQDAYQASGARLAGALDGLDVMRTRVDPDQQPTLEAAPSDGWQEDHPSDHLNALSLHAETVPAHELRALSQTTAGAEVIADALERKGRGEESFLDGVQCQANDAQSIELQDALSTSVGARIFKLAGNDELRTEARSALMRGLSSMGSVWGTSDDHMKVVVDQLERFAPTRQWVSDYNDAVSAATDKSAFGQSLKGVALAFGAASMAGDLGHFGDLPTRQKLSTLSGGLGLANDGAQLVLDSFAAFAGSEGAAGASAALARFGGPLVSVVGAAGAGLDAIHQFSDGNTVGGVSSTLMTMGNLAFAASPFLAEAAPVAVAAGLLLSTAGFVVGMFESPEDPWSDDASKINDALRGWGVDEDVADRLDEVNADGESFGAYVQAAAKQSGVSSLHLLRAMNDWPEERLDQFLDVARLSHDTDDGNDARQANAAQVLGDDLAQQLEDGRHRQTGDRATGLPRYDARVIARVGQWLRSSDGGTLLDPELPRPTVAALTAPPGDSLFATQSRPLFPAAA